MTIQSFFNKYCDILDFYYKFLNSIFSIYSINTYYCGTDIFWALSKKCMKKIKEDSIFYVNEMNASKYIEIINGESHSLIYESTLFISYRYYGGLSKYFEKCLNLHSTYTKNPSYKEFNVQGIIIDYGEPY